MTGQTPPWHHPQVSLKHFYSHFKCCIWNGIRNESRSRLTLLCAIKFYNVIEVSRICSVSESSPSGQLRNWNKSLFGTLQLWNGDAAVWPMLVCLQTDSWSKLATKFVKEGQLGGAVVGAHGSTCTEATSPPAEVAGLPPFSRPVTCHLSPVYTLSIKAKNTSLNLKV